jgi:hypothetical protein
LVCVSRGRGKIGFQFELDTNARARRADNQLCHVCHERSNVHRDGSERLATRKGEQALDERLCTLCRLEGAIDHALFAIPTDAAPPEQVEATHDWREQIVQIVRDSARKLAHGLQLLALAQLFLCRFQLGYRCLHLLRQALSEALLPINI